MGLYTIHSRYEHVINFKSEKDAVLSIVDGTLSMGPCRIQFKEKNSLEDENIQTIQISEDGIQIDGEFQEMNVWENEEIFLEDVSKETLEELKNIIEKNQEDIFSKDAIDQLIYQTICSNLKSKDYVSLIGFGPGLTPLGDDCLIGYLVGENALRKNTIDQENIYEIAKTKTTLISSEFIYQMIHNQISDDIKNLLQQIQKHQSIQKECEKILNFGHSSGWGILFGLYTNLSNE